MPDLDIFEQYLFNLIKHEVNLYFELGIFLFYDF